MAAEHSVQFTSGTPETILEPLAPEMAEALAAAESLPSEDRRDAVAAVAARDPRCLPDALRAAGWRGSGYVRWRHESNRGFLRSLDALRAAAAAIGETEEEQRCDLFLRQLDPEWGVGTA